MSIFIEKLAADTILKKLQANPQITKREMGVYSVWKEDKARNNRPLTEQEMQRFRDLLGQK